MSPFGQQVSGDAKLVRCLDRRDVLTDEPGDIRRMGRDHEMTRAGNGHQRRSGEIKFLAFVEKAPGRRGRRAISSLEVLCARKTPRIIRMHRAPILMKLGRIWPANDVEPANHVKAHYRNLRRAVHKIEGSNHGAQSHWLVHRKS